MIRLSNGQWVQTGRLPLTPYQHSTGFYKVVTPLNCPPKAVLKFANYYSPFKDLAPPPISVDYYTKANQAIINPYLNTSKNDCVVASAYHAIGVWTANETGIPVIASDSEVLNAYTSICGPDNTGCAIVWVLDAFQNTGLIAANQKHQIDGYISVDWTNQAEVQAAIDLFGGLTVGLYLPAKWLCANCVWDICTDPWIAAHCVRAVGYDAAGVKIATWGHLNTITWPAFASSNIEECYVELGKDWYSNNSLAPNGVNVAALQADLQSLKNGIIPYIPPQPIPPPPAPPSPVPNVFDTWINPYRINRNSLVKFLAGANYIVGYYKFVPRDTYNQPFFWRCIHPCTKGQAVEFLSPSLLLPGIFDIFKQ